MHWTHAPHVARRPIPIYHARHPLGGVLAATHTSRLHRVCTVFQLGLDAMLRLFPATPEAEIRGKPWKTGPAHLLPKTFFIFPFNTWECEEWNSTQYTPLKKAIRKVQFSVSKCEELGPRWNEAAGESEELGTRRLESQPRPALIFAPKTTAANFEQYTVHSTKEGYPKSSIFCVLCTVVKFGIFRFLDFHFCSQKHM